MSKHFIIFGITVFLLVFIIFPYCTRRILGKLVLNRYLKQEYHLVYNEIKVNYIGNNAHANIKGIHGDRHRWWISAYEVKMPFMDKTFEIWIDKRNYKIFGSEFYEKIIYDNRFQHMYSEWVKKQVGIEDENVELYFNRAMCGSRVIGDNIYIDFDKITALDNLEEDICKNTHNLYIRSNHYEQGVDVKINNIDNIKEVLNYADLIEKKIKPRVFIDTNHFVPFESNHLFICFLTQSGENDIDIKYDYDNNTKLYRYHNRDSEWIEYE